LATSIGPRRQRRRLACRAERLRMAVSIGDGVFHLLPESRLQVSVNAY
jgi:hypothetical protein